jgi:hypothetical protein
MPAFNLPGMSYTGNLQGSHFPKDEHRQNYLFEERIAAMERRIRDGGLPNQLFPFVAAQCVATPEWNVLREAPNFYDAVCVLRGIRPVALLSIRDMQQDPTFRDHLLRAMENKGLSVCEDPLLPDYIVGEPTRVANVLRIIRQRLETGDYSERYHRELGSALAYPTGAVERFIQALARGHSPLEANMIEAAFPLAEESSLTVRLPNGRIAAIC